MFFYDQYGGDTVAVAWRRPALEPAPFRVMRCAGTRPVDVAAGTVSELHVCADTAAALEDMQRLGAGLVRRIRVQQHPAPAPQVPR